MCVTVIHFSVTVTHVSHTLPVDVLVIAHLSRLFNKCVCYYSGSHTFNQIYGYPVVHIRVYQTKYFASRPICKYNKAYKIQNTCI